MELPESSGQQGKSLANISFLDNQYYQGFSEEVFLVRDVASLLEETRVVTLKKLLNHRTRTPTHNAEFFRNDAREQSLRVFLEQSSKPLADVPRPKSAALARLRASMRSTGGGSENVAMHDVISKGRKSSPIVSKLRPKSAPISGCPSNKSNAEAISRLVRDITVHQLRKTERSEEPLLQMMEEDMSKQEESILEMKDLRLRCLASLQVLMIIYKFAMYFHLRFAFYSFTLL